VRLRIAVSMPEKGGRPTIVGCEVRAAPNAPDSRRRWHFVVGYVERVRKQTIQGARDRVMSLMASAEDERPCVFVDVGTPQGFALRRSLRDAWPKTDEIHRPHAYERTRFDSTMFATFLEAYADGRITFLDDLDFRTEIDRALVLYRSGGVKEAGDELSSEDEGLVHALSLAMMFPTHGTEADQLIPAES